MGWGSKTSKVGFKMPHHVYSYSVPFWRNFTFWILNSFFAIPFAGNVFIRHYYKFTIKINILQQMKWLHLVAIGRKEVNSHQVLFFQSDLCWNLNWNNSLRKLWSNWSSNIVLGERVHIHLKLLRNRFRPLLFSFTYWIRI